MKFFIAIALLFAALVTNSVYATEFKWEHFGAAPYATTQVEAMRTRESAFRKLGFPEQVVPLLMKKTEQPGTPMRIVNGDHLSAMLSKGGVAHKDVLVDFVKPPIKEKMEYAAPAQKWQVSWQGKTYTVILPEVCNNWSALLPIVEVAKEVPKGDCLRYNVDGRDNPLVKHPLQLVVSFYNHSDADLHRLMADQCFYAEDGATHQRLRLDRECKVCEGEHQAIWPADVAVGTKTEYIFSVYNADGKTLGFPSSYGAVYVPRWFVTSSLWCFPAEQTYWGKAPTWYGGPNWHYEGYYDLVTQSEIQDDLSKGHKEFHRVIKPDGVLGK